MHSNVSCCSVGDFSWVFVSDLTKLGDTPLLAEYWLVGVNNLALRPAVTGSGGHTTLWRDASEGLGLREIIMETNLCGTRRMLPPCNLSGILPRK